MVYAERHNVPIYQFTSYQSRMGQLRSNNSRLKVQKLRDQSESSSVFLRGLYALGTHLVRSVYGVTGTELVRSWYGVGTEQLRVFFLGPPTPPKIHFKMILSSFPLRKKLRFFFTPPGPYPVCISTQSRDGNPGPLLVAEVLDLEHALMVQLRWHVNSSTCFSTQM